jgi:hypothetical protein
MTACRSGTAPSGMRRSEERDAVNAARRKTKTEYERLVELPAGQQPSQEACGDLDDAQHGG